MKIIALLAMLGITLVTASGAVPKASVGGALTFAVMFLGAALVLGLYEAWSNRRGPLGWIVNIPVAFVGGLIGALAGTSIMETLLTLMPPNGSLMEIGGPLLYASINAQMLFTLAGTWLALQVVNRWR